MARNPFPPDSLVELRIDKLAARGYGLGRSRNVVFFVPCSVPGDRLRVRVMRRRRGYNFAVCDEVLDPSPLRVDPGCPHFAHCGGCAHLNMDYAAQLSWKRAVLMEQMRQIPIEVCAAESSPPWEYRNKLLMPIVCGDQGLVCGFYARQSHQLIPIGDCRLQTPAVNQLRREFLAAARRLPPGDQERLRWLFIRCNRRGDLQLVVVSDGWPDLQPLVDELIAVPGRNLSLGQFANDAPGNVPFQRGEKNRYAADPLRWWAGEPSLGEEVAGCRFELEPESFFQVNLHMLETLVARVRTLAGTGETLLDLYAGAGLFARTLAASFRRIHLVESSPAAAASFRRAVPESGRMVFHSGDAAREASRLAASGLRPDCLVTDPPRSGLDAETLVAILALAPRRIVMVSCNPATLARDLKNLEEGGYQAETLIPLDQFPQTAHLEAVCRLTRRASGDSMGASA